MLIIALNKRETIWNPNLQPRVWNVKKKHSENIGLGWDPFMIGAHKGGILYWYNVGPLWGHLDG